ncbi:MULTISPECIES: type II toxin-antitoxin system RelE/ParE family toxin [unclassified Neorhizobium]|uniref:type II toxin-antitoxin system RelE/ParE family toxin n=1 Tax=unclassified Neorhizobium TaxID=2629175 RepID=UPI001FF57EB8|nr:MULTISPECIES: type II toxin-antitoxin system RelE/ParE family toxin [unclassified Neorhizobium]MCJ9668966.1 type II toxin-antitoxin system RelE/ParE family toxin [Neorhizobium sp. SHOUNA12B]MCJ9744920.1 type II toxin-antitoxin system RelE/ParE family toxin [Neorhizobium sp. SHOUNA12A]
MKRYYVRLTEEAEADVAWIYRFVRRKSASTAVARNYIGRIRTLLKEFEVFPERGSIRDIRDGMRVVGFGRRVSIAFIVESDDVVVLRVLYAGQQFRTDEDGVL